MNKIAQLVLKDFSREEILSKLTMDHFDHSEVKTIEQDWERGETIVIFNDESCLVFHEDDVFLR